MRSESPEVLALNLLTMGLLLIVSIVGRIREGWDPSGVIITTLAAVLTISVVVLLILQRRAAKRSPTPSESDGNEAP